MFGFRAFDEFSPVADGILFPPSTALVPASRTGRSSQKQPEVMAMVAAMTTAKPAKADIEDVELRVMGLILNNWLLIKASELVDFERSFQPFELYLQRL